MTLTIDIPENVVREAESRGLTVDALVSQTLSQIGEEPVSPGFVRLGTPTRTPEEAGASIREIARRHTLGGLNIKDLINEGRRI